MRYCVGFYVVGPHKPDGAPRKRGDAQFSTLDLSLRRLTGA